MGIIIKPKIKYDQNFAPLKTPNEYMQYGLDRIVELMQKTDTKTKFFPRSVGLVDLDFIMNEYVTNELELITEDNQDGKLKVPVIYMEAERWGVFAKTWNLVDNDNNIPTPYIIIRRIEKAQGTRIGDKFRVPQGMRFKYMDVPILDDGETIMLRFKIPEEINVDLTYELSLFTKFREDVNLFDEIVLRKFSSIQSYQWLNGFPLPIKLESMTETNTIENSDNDRLYVAKYNLLLMGYILDEKEFQIVKTFRAANINVGLRG